MLKIVIAGVVSAFLTLSASAKDNPCKGTNKKEFQQRLAAGDPDAVAREKACSEQKQEKRANFGPYIFTTHASAQAIKPLIVKDNLKDGYTLEQETAFTLRFAKNAPMPVLGAAFMIPSACTGLQTRKVWTYTLVEQDGVTQRAAFQALLDSAAAPVK
jgi:hypothetical protein